MVVVVLPDRGEATGAGQVIEDFHGQELVGQATVEALGVSILPGTAWVDVQRLNVHAPQPRSHSLSNELWAVVATNLLWHSMGL